MAFYLLIFHNKENGYGKENFCKANYDVNSLYCLLKNACPTPRVALRRFAALPSLPTKKPPVWVAFLLAGMAGFEPTNTRVKVWCLTAWRHPYIGLFWKAILLYHAKPRVSSAFQRKRCSFGKNIVLPSIILPIFSKAYSLKCKKSGFQKRFSPALALRARQALRACRPYQKSTHTGACGRQTAALPPTCCAKSFRTCAEKTLRVFPLLCASCKASSSSLSPVPKKHPDGCFFGTGDRT